MKVIITNHAIQRFQERYSYKKYSDPRAKIKQMVEDAFLTNRTLPAKEADNIKYIKIGTSSYFVIDVVEAGKEVKVVTFVKKTNGRWIDFVFKKVKI